MTFTCTYVWAIHLTKFTLNFSCGVFFSLKQILLCHTLYTGQDFLLRHSCFQIITENLLLYAASRCTARSVLMHTDDRMAVLPPLLLMLRITVITLWVTLVYKTQFNLWCACMYCDHTQFCAECNANEEDSRRCQQKKPCNAAESIEASNCVQ